MTFKTVHRWIRRVWVTFGIAAFAFFAWNVQAHGVPAGAWTSDARVEVETAAWGRAFRPVAATPGARPLVFLPGGLIDSDAYLPLVRGIADAGIPVALVEVPWRAAPTDAARQTLWRRITDARASLLAGAADEAAPGAAASASSRPAPAAEAPGVSTSAAPALGLTAPGTSARGLTAPATFAPGPGARAVAPGAAPREAEPDAARVPVRGTRGVAIGGHSRGGMFAATFAADHPDLVDGLVLIGTTHPRDRDLSGAGWPVLKVLGTADCVASVRDARAHASRLPAATEWFEVAGGNHRQFGYYGWQLGDCAAAISREEQHRQTVHAVVAFLRGPEGAERRDPR
jgi:pimeloyl-ACP methyl ester carboxylesterase